jgi:hypothetical protein
VLDPQASIPFPTHLQIVVLEILRFAYHILSKLKTVIQKTPAGAGASHQKGENLSSTNWRYMGICAYYLQNSTVATAAVLEPVADTGYRSAAELSLLDNIGVFLAAQKHTSSF